MARPRTQKSGTPATPEEQAAMDKIARVVEPEAWAEYDAGNGTCSNQAGWKCVESIKQAQRLIRAYPSILGIILSSSQHT